jgi:hypothetical protein
MNTKEWAEKLKGEVDPYTLRRELAADNMLVLCGVSDDLIESYGFDDEEFGAYDGITVYIDQTGMHKYKKHNSIPVKVEWAPEDDSVSWRITPMADIPHEKFDMTDGDEVYCRAIIVHRDDLPKSCGKLTESELELARRIVLSTLSYLEDDNRDISECLDEFKDDEGRDDMLLQILKF